MRDDPTWLDVPSTLAMHERLLAEHGGAAGVRSMALLESALNRPRQHFSYGESDVFALAGVLAEGLARNHPFVDGNKRVAFLATFVFLLEKGWHLHTPEEQAVIMTLGLADNSISADGYAQWLRDTSTRQA